MSMTTRLVFLLSQIIAYGSGIDLDITSDTPSIERTNHEEEKGFFANASTLEDVWNDLKAFVPNRGSNGYVQPKNEIIELFGKIVLNMLTIGQADVLKKAQKDWFWIDCNGEALVDRYGLVRAPDSCESIDLGSLKGKYRIGTFVDRDNGRKYCILATTSILYPWGNVIVDLDTSSATKNLSFDCPHPKFDAQTAEQGIRMLKGTRARSWIVAGSHRMANNDSPGTCQPQHYVSDAAHSPDNCFHAAVEAVKFYYDSVVFQDYTSVQLHGMGKATCGTVDTFLSHGSCSITPADEKEEKIDILQKIAQSHPLDDGHHAVAGRDGGACNLCGSTNIQGRLINGVPRNDLCNTVASSHNGQFIQIEQKLDYRTEAYAQFWNDVFNEAYPQFSALSKPKITSYEQVCTAGREPEL